MIKVLGVKIIDRIREAGLTQGILSRHSSVITTRLGFHEVTDSVCSREAYIILHLNDERSESAEMISELAALGGVEIREIDFSKEGELPEGVKETSGIEILCILAEKDKDVVANIQRVLTTYGCTIRTRLGVNESFFGQPAGLIILELTGDTEQRLFLEKDLKRLGRVHVRSMSF